MVKPTDMESLLTPMEACMKEIGSKTNKTDMVQNPGTLTKSNIQETSLMERKLEMAVLNLKEDSTKASS